MTQLLNKKGHTQCTKLPLLGDLGEVMISNLTPVYRRGWFPESNPKPVAFGGRHLPSHQSSTSRWHNCYLQKNKYCSLLLVEKKSGTPNKLQQKVKNPRKWKYGFSHPWSIRIKLYMLVVPLHMRQSGTTFQTELHFCCPNITLFFLVSNVHTFHYSRKATSTTSLSITQLKPKKIKTEDHSYLTKRKCNLLLAYTNNINFTRMTFY